MLEPFLRSTAWETLKAGSGSQFSDNFRWGDHQMVRVGGLKLRAVKLCVGVLLGQGARLESIPTVSVFNHHARAQVNLFCRGIICVPFCWLVLGLHWNLEHRYCRSNSKISGCRCDPQPETYKPSLSMQLITIPWKLKIITSEYIFSICLIFFLVTKVKMK